METSYGHNQLTINSNNCGDKRHVDWGGNREVLIFALTQWV